MTVISNDSPLIAFARINRLELLGKVVGNIIIPQAVAREIWDYQGKGKASIALSNENWISSASVQSEQQVRLLLPTLDRGEAEVIALALEVKLDGTEQGRICIPAQPRAKGNTVIQNVREVCCNSLLAIRDRWISASMPKCHSVGLPQYR